jgi:hypothetical protein
MAMVASAKAFPTDDRATEPHGQRVNGLEASGWSWLVQTEPRVSPDISMIPRRTRR